MEIGGVVHDVRLFPRTPIGILHQTVDEKIAVEHDERLILYLRDAKCPAPCKRMVGARDKGTCAVKELCIDEA